MRGRKPIPNAIKRKRGDGKRDSGKRVIPEEPKAPPGAPPVPPFIRGDVLEAWHAFSAQLAELDTLHTTDGAALLILCEAWAQMRESARGLADSGAVIRHPNGQPGASPWLKPYHDAAKLVKSMLAEFGLTPSSRSRASAAAAAKPDDDDGDIGGLDLVAALGGSAALAPRGAKGAN